MSEQARREDASRELALHAGEVVREVLEGEIVEPVGYGSSYHYPYCNAGQCSGCIPQEIVDDYADFVPEFQRLLFEGVGDLLQNFDFDVPPQPRGAAAAYAVFDDWTEPTPVPVWPIGVDRLTMSYEQARREWEASYRYGPLGLDPRAFRVPTSGI